MTTLDIFLLIVLVLGALATVMIRSLLRSAIALALTSAVLSMIIFRLGAPLAAVFELSVCTGLISVLFISTISLTEPRTADEKIQHKRTRLKKFWYLPFLVIILGIVLIQLNKTITFPMPTVPTVGDPRAALWSDRSLDVLGQVIILLVGVFGIVILFKERKK